MRYFENRTVGRTPEGQRLLDKLREILHQVKIPVFISPGDFVCVFNNYAVHAKEIVEIADEEALKQRWIIKTVNVDRLSDHAAHLIPGTTHLING